MHASKSHETVNRKGKVGSIMTEVSAVFHFINIVCAKWRETRYFRQIHIAKRKDTKQTKVLDNNIIFPLT